MRLIYVCIATLFLVASIIAFAEQVEVTNIEDNKNGAYQAVRVGRRWKIFP